MAYYVGVSSSTSSLAAYHHKITSSLQIRAKSCVASTQTALVESGGNTKSYTELADAVTAYEAASGATLTLLKNVTGNVTLTKPGTVDLNGHTLTGYITVTEGDGGTVTITGGKVVTNSTIHDAILHDGSGTLTLSNIRAEGYHTRYGVRSKKESLVLDCTGGERCHHRPGCVRRGIWCPEYAYVQGRLACGSG